MNDLKELLADESDRLLRFWFGAAAIGYGFFLATAAGNHFEYRVTMLIMNRYLWLALFLLVGCTTIYAAVKKNYSKATLVIEGYVGAALWVAVSISSGISQGSIGAVTIAGIISIYLLVRYPEWQ